jgi:hypothetical protein
VHGKEAGAGEAGTESDETWLASVFVDAKRDPLLLDARLLQGRRDEEHIRVLEAQLNELTDEANQAMEHGRVLEGKLALQLEQEELNQRTANGRRQTFTVAGRTSVVGFLKGAAWMGGGGV